MEDYDYEPHDEYTDEDRMLDIEVYVDLYKDVYGVKPRGDRFRELHSWDEDKMRYHLDMLSRALDEQIEEEKRIAAEARVKFEEFIESMMNDYQISFGTALRWEMEAHDAMDLDELLFAWGVDLDLAKEYKNRD